MKYLLILFLSVSMCSGAILNLHTNSGWVEIGAGGTSGPILTNVITVSCWFTLTTNFSGSGVLGVMLDKGRTTAVPSDSLYNISIFTNKLRFQYMTSGPIFHRWVTEPFFSDVGVPTHVAVTFTYGTGSSLKYYVNGTNVAGAWRQGDGNTVPASNTNPLWYMSDAVANNFRGVLNDVAIWNTILTPAQIQLLYASNIKRIAMQVSPANLVLYSPLDDLPAEFGATDSTYKNFGLEPKRGSLEGFGAARAWYETRSSYPPNE